MTCEMKKLWLVHQKKKIRKKKEKKKKTKKMGMLGMLCIAPAVLLIWTPVHNSKKTHSQSNLQQQQRQK